MRCQLAVQPDRSPTRRGAGGFTLIEMMTVVTILAVMAGLAAPSMSRLLAQQRLKAAASDLHLAMVKARGEAIKRNCNVGVAPAGTWASGWTVAPVTSATPPDCPVGTGATVLQHGPTSSVTVTSDAAVVIYMGTGRTTPATAGSTFVFSSSSTDTSRCMAIDSTGRPYLKEGSSC